MGVVLGGLRDGRIGLGEVTTAEEDVTEVELSQLGVGCLIHGLKGGNCLGQVCDGTRIVASILRHDSAVIVAERQVVTGFSACGQSQASFDGVDRGLFVAVVVGEKPERQQGLGAGRGGAGHKQPDGF